MFKLVVDANVLVAEALRYRGRRLLREPRMQLYIAAAAWDEASYELPKRLRVVAKNRGLDEDEARTLLTDTLLLARRNVNIVPAVLYASYESTARARIPQDPDDWPSVALALTLELGIWTEDRDFFGCGLATWTTPVLDHYLTTESA